MTTEYELARSHAALIDLNPEGRFKISGPNALSTLGSTFSMDLTLLRPWKGVMGLFLSESASCLAIATVFRTDDDYFVFTEALTAQKLRAHLQAEASARGAQLDDLSDSHAWLSVVGPSAQDVMVKVAGEDVIGLPYLSCEDNADLDGKVFRMGNTGEFEYRILAAMVGRDALAEHILTAGAAFGIGRADPSIFNVLMLEMRSLSFADLTESKDPIDAGLHWMINFRNDTLLGGEIIHQRKTAPAHRSLMVCLDQGGQAETGDTLHIEGENVGFLTNVAYSPTLDRHIGLAFIKPQYGWVGVSYRIQTKGGDTSARAVSAPLFLTKTGQSS
jgi:glycine cleavage system aminomethyltransferase T